MEIEECKKSSPKINWRMFIDGILMIVFSIVLYNLGISTLLYLAPLLVFSARYGRNRGSILICISLVICFLLEFVHLHLQKESSSTSLIELCLLLFIPMSLSAAGILWMYAKKLKLVFRLLVSVLPSVVFASIISLVLVVDRALFASLYSTCENAFATMVSPILDTFGFSADISWLFLLFLVSMSSLILPTTLVAVCANCFIYETVLHSRENDWESKVKAIEFSPNMVWFFIFFFVLILLFYFVSAPLALEVIVINIALLFGVLYSIQGFAVLYSWLSRSMERLKSMSLFLVLFIISSVVPGINFIVLFGLPLLGLLESFFDLKKIGERKNEDYS